MLVVVGGHSRNIGKTSVVAGIIRKLRDWKWTAVKITQHGHGICSHAGEACGCESGPEQPFTLTEEFEAGKTDSGRFLAAGAARSFWLRAPGELTRAKTTIAKILNQSENVIIESNSVLELVHPDLFLMVLDFGCQDFKPSSLRLLDRADAFLVIDRGINALLWEDIARGRWDAKPQFVIKPPAYVTKDVCALVEQARKWDRPPGLSESFPQPA